MAESRARAFAKLAKDVDASGNIVAEGISSDVTLGGATIYASRASLPTSGNTAGDQAYVTENNRLYIWNGSGWYNVALLNVAPSIQSVLDSDGNSTPFRLSIEGATTTITITATDSDGDPVTYSATADSDFAGLATISDSDNVFTITPFSQDSASTTSGTITFKATDGVNIASSGVQTFTLSFVSAPWDETVLSIGTSSTNSLDNSTFIDRSTNAHTVTPIGSPVQTAFHPYLDKWSVEFDGDNDYFTLTSGALGSGDFTVECWINLISYQIYNCIFDNRVSAGTAGGFNFLVNGSGYIDVYTAGASRITDTVAIPLHTWTHVALVRSSGTWKIYKNGTAVSGSYSSSANITDTTLGIATARTALGLDVDFHGYISNLRTVAGTAVYTANFTPPTEKLTAITNTQLLLNSNRFIDTSSNSTAITVTGTPKISAFNPFGQGSEYAVGENKGSTYFDETSSEYLIADLNTLDNIDTTWTVECWAYPTTDGSPEYIIGFNGKDSGNDYIIGVTASYLNAVSKGTQDAYILDGQWNHVAITCDGTTITLWINGVSRATQSYTGANPLSNCVAAVGCEFDAANGGAPGNYFNGYISDWGVSDTCKYTAEFTPPTSPVSADADVLYVPMDNAGIFDKTGNHILTLAGNTSTSTTQTKFADTAVYFDGTGDYAQIAQSPIFNFGTSDFTIEMWIYTGNVSSKQDILDKRSAANQSAWFLSMNLLASRVEFLSASTGWAGALRSDTGLPSNQWVHIAVTRDGSTFRLFQDGSQVATNTSANSIDDQDTPLIIGSGPDTNYFNGYIENLQILKGVAKYTANFTPPTQTQGRTYQAES